MKNTILVATKNRKGMITSLEDIQSFGNLEEASRKMPKIKKLSRQYISRILREGKIYNNGNIQIAKKKHNTTTRKLLKNK